MTPKYSESSAEGGAEADAESADAAGLKAGAVPGTAGDVAIDALAVAEAEAIEMKDAWLRAKAETENVRRIAQADVAKAHKFAIERFAEDMLPVKDALEQTLAAGDVSLESLRSGAELTLKALQAAFERARVVEMSPEGQKFDPNHHQAMQMVPSDLPANTVAAVFQKGYLVNDRVLRPALVTVSQGPASTA